MIFGLFAFGLVVYLDSLGVNLENQLTKIDIKLLG